MNAYEKSSTDLERSLKSNISKGLTDAQAEERLKRDGPNRLPEGHRDTWLSIFIGQFQSPLIYILLIAAAIIFFVGHHRLDT